MKKAVFALLLPVLFVAVVQAQDEAEYKRWKLDFSYSMPANVVMKTALGDVRTCWYMTYTVKNPTDRELPLHLQIRAETDTDQTYRDSIAPLAQRQLEKKTGKKYQNALQMSRGTIQPGETIEAVAFFGNIDPNWDTLHVFTAGLMDTVDQVKGKLYFENRVFVTTWFRPGDEFDSVDDVIKFKGDKWIIEGDRAEIPQTKPE